MSSNPILIVTHTYKKHWCVLVVSIIPTKSHPFTSNIQWDPVILQTSQSALLFIIHVLVHMYIMVTPSDEQLSGRPTDDGPGLGNGRGCIPLLYHLPVSWQQQQAVVSVVQGKHIPNIVEAGPSWVPAGTFITGIHPF